MLRLVMRRRRQLRSCCPSLSYWALLASIIGLSLWKDHIIIKQRQIQSNWKHIFILRSFHYQESYSFNNLPSNTQPNQSVLATIFNAENDGPSGMTMNGSSFPLLDLRCVFFSKSGLFPVKNVPAEVLPLYKTGDVNCRLDIFRFVCKFPSPSAHPISHFGIKLANGPLMLQSNVETPSPRRRRLVFCPGRIYNFERWHILVTVMELYRIYRVELTVVHVQSVLVKIYELLKMYQQNGLLAIRPYMGMPTDLGTIDYNPNAETVWTGQTVHMQDCLYAFRENTDYLIFADWDDILRMPQGQSLLSIVDNFFAARPSISSMYIQRFEGNLPTLDMMSEQKMTIFDWWRQGIDYTLAKRHQTPHGKTICRPALIESTQAHWPMVFKSGFSWDNISIHLLHMVHARIQVPKLDQVLELWPLIDSFKARLKLHGGAAKALLSELPTKETMVSQVVNCFGNWAPIMTARKLNQTRCPNHYICPFHDAADSNCLVYDAKWSVNMVPMPTQRFGVVVAFYQSTKYVLSKGCKSNIK